MRSSLGAHSQRAALDAVLRSDLYSFVRAIFPVVSPGGPFVPNWHLEAIAHALTRVLHGEVKRLIINVPPRHLKSICASVAFPAFVLGKDPARRIMCVSYMVSKLYGRLFPRTRISRTKDTELETLTTARGFRYATSVISCSARCGGFHMGIKGRVDRKALAHSTTGDTVKLNLWLTVQPARSSRG